MGLLVRKDCPAGEIRAAAPDRAVCASGPRSARPLTILPNSRRGVSRSRCLAVPQQCLGRNAPAVAAYHPSVEPRARSGYEQHRSAFRRSVQGRTRVQLREIARPSHIINLIEDAGTPVTGATYTFRMYGLSM